VHGKELALSTQHSYARVWDKWIGPRLVKDITPAELARFRSDIERDGARSPTVLRVLAVLGSVMTEAVRQGQIAASRRARSAARGSVAIERCGRRRPGVSRSSARRWTPTSTRRS
jgi:hypothetical protein